MTALSRLEADTQALADEVEHGLPPEDAAHRLRILARQIAAQREMQDKGISE